MPLYDHFRPPLSSERRWTSFHATWSVSISGALNHELPDRFLAESHTCFGRTADDTTFEYDRDGGPQFDSLPKTSLPIRFPDVVEVKVFDLERARQLVTVIELVSPANKDHPDEREAFAYKSLGYLKTGAGLVVVDIVTDTDFNLHDELVRVGRSGGEGMSGTPATYVAAYRPVRRREQNILDVWLHPLAVGGPLPTVPLALKGYGCVPLDLGVTYAEACERNRIP